MTYRVARVINPVQVVINAGSREGVKEGQRFQIYSIGEEVIDPETGESLGRLEEVKGIGRITHVQERIATLESDMTEPPPKYIRRSSSPFFRAIGEGWEERIPPPIQADFKDPLLGDLVRPV